MDMRGRCGGVVVCDDSGILLHPSPAVQLVNNCAGPLALCSPDDSVLQRPYQHGVGVRRDGEYGSVRARTVI